MLLIDHFSDYLTPLFERVSMESATFKQNVVYIFYRLKFTSMVFFQGLSIRILVDSVILPRSRWLDPDSDWTDGSRIRYLRCKGSGNAREVVLFSYLWSGRVLHGDQTGEHNRSGPRAAGQRQHSQALVTYIGR